VCYNQSECREIAPGYFELVYGYRRYLGALKAGLEIIPCTIMDIDDRQAREIMLPENAMREDPNPMEVADFIEGMKRDFDYKEKQIGAIIDKSESYVSNVLRVFREPFLREMVQSGKTTFSLALELLAIRPNPLTEPAEYQKWRTFGAKSSAISSSKAIRRLRQKDKPREMPAHDFVHNDVYAKEIPPQKEGGDDVPNFAKTVIWLLLTYAIGLISRLSFGKQLSIERNVDSTPGTVIPHYVLVTPE